MGLPIWMCGEEAHAATRNFACSRRSRPGAAAVVVSDVPYSPITRAKGCKPHMTLTRIDIDLTEQQLRKTLVADASRGPLASARVLPPKYFYGRRGRELFEHITLLARSKMLARF